jgi:hypothetical protein
MQFPFFSRAPRLFIAENSQKKVRQSVFTNFLHTAGANFFALFGAALS